MNKNLKTILWSLLVGVAITLLTGGFLLTISLDMRWMTAFIMVLCFLAGLWGGSRKTLRPWLFLVGIPMPFLPFLVLVIMPDLPSLWALIPMMVVITAVGVLGAQAKATRGKSLSYVAGALVSFMMVLTVPWLIEDDLMKTANDPVPPFSFVSLEEQPIHSDEFKGRVVVLDFFGTWCKPCIAELPELAKVKAAFEATGEVSFHVINSDQGGDNLEKARRFAQKYNYGFNYGYDFDRKAYKIMGLAGAGVPSLVIIDKKGAVRLRHVGYNKAETEFADKLIELISELLAE